MFEWLRKKLRPSSDDAIRETLFGDMLLAAWANAENTDPPWREFRQVLQQLEVGDRATAQNLLQQILASPNLESRHYLQAWSELRRLGVRPTTEAKQLLGVVVEVRLEEGLDILAAYSDRSARYFNYSGAAVIWDRPDNSLDHHIALLFDAAGVILGQIGVWEGSRPPAPPHGQARINMLAPAGLFFGQASLQALTSDRLAAPAMAAATNLMQALIEKAQTS